MKSNIAVTTPNVEIKKRSVLSELGDLTKVIVASVAIFATTLTIIVPTYL